MSDYEGFNNYYNEWDECDAPAIIYDDKVLPTNFSSAGNDEIVVLSDSSSNCTVDYSLENSEPFSTSQSQNEGLISLKNNYSASDSDQIQNDILNKINGITEKPEVTGFSISQISQNQDFICLKNNYNASDLDKFPKDRSNNINSISDKREVRKEKTAPAIKDKVKSKEDSLKRKLENDKLKEIKKNENLKQKKMKLVLSAQQRSIKPEEVIKRLTVNIDTNIVNSSYGSFLIPTLQKEEIKYKINFLKHENTIVWTKTLTEAYMDDQDNVCSRETEVTEKLVLSIISWNILIDLIKNNKLISYIINLKSNENERLTIVIFELDKYLNYQTVKINRAMKSTINGSQKPKAKKSEKQLEDAPKLSAEDIEIALTEAQLLTNTCHRKFENAEDLANFVFQMTRSISQIDSKRERNEKDQQTLSWFAKADSKAGVSVDKNGNGLQQLWQQQLCQFNNVGLEVAQAIISCYKSPQSLLAAYKGCKDEKAADELLSNLMIRREAGILSSSRRVGCELSKKIHHFFTSTTPSITF